MELDHGASELVGQSCGMCGTIGSISHVDEVLARMLRTQHRDAEVLASSVSRPNPRSSSEPWVQVDLSGDSDRSLR